MTRRRHPNVESTMTLPSVFLLFLLTFCRLLDVVSSSPLSDGPWGNTDPIADPKAIVKSDNGLVRFTVLTGRLIRIEQSSSQNAFEDRKTVAVINRKLPVPKFEQHYDKETSLLTIQTDFLTLFYKVGQGFARDTLWLEGRFSKTNPKKWAYHYGDDDPMNLLGTIRTLDKKDVVSLNCSLREESDHCEPGLMSRSGYAIVNDTSNWALDDTTDWWVEPNRDDIDFYFFGHGHAYYDALSDYIKIGGKIPLPPRYAFGVWFSRWYDYTPASAAEVVKGYELHSIPLDVFVLDMVSLVGKCGSKNLKHVNVSPIPVCHVELAQEE